MFLAADAPKPTIATIDADPNKGTLTIAPMAALSVTAAHSDFSAGSYRLHAYFHHHDSGAETAVATSDVLVFPRTPVFDFTSFFSAPGAGPTVDGLVGFGFENQGTATCTLEFFTVRAGTVSALAATVESIRNTGTATDILEGATEVPPGSHPVTLPLRDGRNDIFVRFRYGPNFYSPCVSTGLSNGVPFAPPPVLQSVTVSGARVTVGLGNLRSSVLASQIFIRAVPELEHPISHTGQEFVEAPDLGIHLTNFPNHLATTGAGVPILAPAQQASWWEDDLPSGRHVIYALASLHESEIALPAVCSAFEVSAPFTILYAPSFDTPTVASDNLTFTVTNAGQSTCTLHYVVLDVSTTAMPMPGFADGPSYGTEVVGANSSSEVTADVSGLVAATYSIHGYFSLSGAPSAVTVSDEFTVAPPAPTAPLFNPPLTADADVSISAVNTNADPGLLHYVFLPVSEEVPEADDILAHATGNTLLPAAPGSGTIAHTFMVSGTCVLYGFLVIDGQNSPVVSSQPFPVTVPEAVPDPVFSSPMVTDSAVTLRVTHTGTSEYTFHYLVQDAAVPTPPLLVISTNPQLVSILNVAATGADIDLAFSLSGTYRVHGYFEGGGEFSEVVPSDPFTVAVPLPVPRFGDPQVTVTDLGIVVNNDDSSPYTLHYVVLAATEDAPATGFTTGTHYNSTTVAGSGSSIVSVPGLSGGHHIFHAYFSDGTSESDVVSTEVFIVLRAPYFATPVVSGADLSIVAQNIGFSDCTLHYQVLDASEDVPDSGFTLGDHYSRQVVASGVVDFSVSVPGLSPGMYRLHGYFEDDDGGLSGITSSAAFTVLYPPRLETPEVSGTEVRVVVHNDGPTACDLHYVVLTASEDAPAPSFTTGTDHGTVAAGAHVTVTVTNLATGSYLFYAYFSSVGDSTVVSSAPFTTVPAPQISSLTATGAEASFDIYNPDPSGSYTLYYVFLEASEDAPTAQEIRDHTASVDESVWAGPPPGQDFTYTFSESGTYKLHAYFESAGGLRSAVTSSTDTVDVTVATASFLPVLGEPVIVGSQVRIEITNDDAVGYGLRITFSPTSASASVSPHVVSSTIAANKTKTITVGHPDLRLGVDYEAQVVFLDATDSPSAPVTSSPFILLHLPRLRDLSVSGEEVRVTIHNDGAATCTVRYVVLVTSAPTPSAGFSLVDYFSTQYIYGEAEIAAGASAEVSVAPRPRSSARFRWFRVHAYFSYDGDNSGVATTSGAIPILFTPRFDAMIGGTEEAPIVSVESRYFAFENPRLHQTFHYVILEASAAAPETGFTTGATYDSMRVAQNVTFNVPVTGLPNGSYKLHGYFSFGYSNSLVASTDAFTVRHVVPHPVVTHAERGSEAVLLVDNTGSSDLVLHYVVLAASEAAPARGFTTGTTHGIVDAGADDVPVLVSGLPAGAYKFHAYFFSPIGGISGVSSVSFDITTPLPAPQINSLAAAGTQASFNVINPDSSTEYTLYYVFLEASARVPIAREIHDHPAARHEPISGSSETTLTHTFLTAGTYRLHAYFVDPVARFRSPVASSADVTVTSSAFRPVLGEPVVMGSQVRIMVTNSDATGYGMEVGFFPTIAAPVDIYVVSSTIAANETKTITAGLPNLRPGVEYEVRVVFRDPDLGNSDLGISSPFALLHIPRFEGLSVSGEEVRVTAHNDGAATYTLCYVVLPAASPLPSPGFGSADYATDPHLYGSMAVAARASTEVSVAPRPDAALSSRQFRVHAYFSSATGDSGVATSERIPILFAPQFGATVGGTRETPRISVENRFFDSSAPHARYTFHYVVLAAAESAPETGFTTGATYGSAEVAALVTFEVPVVGVPDGAYKLHGYFSVSASDSLVASTDEFTVRSLVRPVITLSSVSGSEVALDVENAGSEDYTLHYVVQEASVPAPAPGFTTGARYATTNVAAGGSTTIPVIGLSTVDYVLYAYFHSATENLNSRVANSKVFSILHAPRFDPPAKSDADLTLPVHNDGGTPCTLHYVVLSAATPVPAANDIKTASTFSGNVRIASRHMVDVSVRGLSAGSYRFHAFFEHSSIAFSPVSSSSGFTISSDAILHAPSLGAPSTVVAATIPVTNVGGTACTLYYVVLPSAQSVPSTSNIQGATDFSGSMSVSSGATVDVVVQGLPFTVHRFHAFFEAADGMLSTVSSSDPFTVTPAPPQLGAPSVISTRVTVSVTNPQYGTLHLVLRGACFIFPCPYVHFHPCEHFFGYGDRWCWCH